MNRREEPATASCLECGTLCYVNRHKLHDDYTPVERDARSSAPLDVERLAEALRLELNRVHKAGEYHELAESVAAEYARLSNQPSTEPGT